MFKVSKPGFIITVMFPCQRFILIRVVIITVNGKVTIKLGNGGKDRAVSVFRFK